MIAYPELYPFTYMLLIWIYVLGVSVNVEASWSGITDGLLLGFDIG